MFFKIKKKNIKDEYKILQQLHYIHTDKNRYFIYEIEPNEDSGYFILILKNDNIRILKEETWESIAEAMGGTNFNSIVRGSLQILRSYIKKQNETIIKDIIIKNEK